MNIKKLVPWNWFKKEEEEAGRTIPVKSEHIPVHGSVAASPLHQFHQEIDRLFDQAFRGFGITGPSWSDHQTLPGSVGSMLKPTLDLGATDKEYTIAVEIPGVDRKDITLEMTGDTLTISGEKKQETKEEQKDYYRMERSYGAFKRVLSLPEDADQSGINATFKKGVLTVTMPRKPLPEKDVRQIDIKTE